MILVGRDAEHGAVWIRGDEIRMVVAIGGKLPSASTVGVHPKARLKSCAPTETYPLLLVSGHRRYSRSSVEKLRRDGWTFVGYPESWDLGDPAPLGLGYTPKTGDILAGRKLGRVTRSTLLLLTDSVTGTAGEQPSIGPLVGLYGNILQNWRDLIPFEKHPARINGSPKTTIEQVAVFLGETLEQQRAQKATAPARDAAAAKVAADRAANFTALNEKLDTILARTAPVKEGPPPVALESLINGALTTETSWRPAPRSRLGDASALAGVEWLIAENKRLTSAVKVGTDVERERDALRSLIGEIGRALRPDDERPTTDPSWVVTALITTLRQRDETEETLRAAAETVQTIQQEVEDINKARDREHTLCTDIIFRITDVIGETLGVQWDPQPDEVPSVTATRFAENVKAAIWKREARAAGSTATVLALLVGLGFASYANPHIGP